MQRFSAEVSGTNVSQEVTWRLEGNQSNQTVINEDGALIVGPDETASQLKVIAEAVQRNEAGGAVAAEITVTVT